MNVKKEKDFNPKYSQSQRRRMTLSASLLQVVFALNHTLSQQEILRAGDGRLTFTTDDLIRHYNCGDLDAVIFSQDTTQVVRTLLCSFQPFMGCV